jgi:hypothetical protein
MKTGTSGKQGVEITFDTPRHLCTVKLWGYWYVKCAETFGATLKEKVKEVNGRDHAWDVLIDVRTSNLYSKKMFGMLDRELSALNTNRIAVLVSATTPLFQSESFFQATRRRVYCYFWSEEGALQWLLNQSMI